MTRVALRNLMIVLNVNFIDSGFLRLCDGTSELVARSSAELRQTDLDILVRSPLFEEKRSASVVGR